MSNFLKRRERSDLIGFRQKQHVKNTNFGVIHPPDTTPEFPRSSVSSYDTLNFAPSDATFPTPHEFGTSVKIISNTPSSVIFSPRAVEDMHIIVDRCPEEVSWLGVVEEVTGAFFVDEVHLVTQEVGPVVTEMLTDGLVELTNKLLNEPNGTEKVSKLRFWGHSHVNMDTFPSAQDQTQIDLWRRNGLPYLIRAIMNKRGKLQLSIFLFDRGIQIDDAPWSVMREKSSERDEFWSKELTAKVRKPVHVMTTWPKAGKWETDGTWDGYDAAAASSGCVKDEDMPDVPVLSVVPDKKFKDMTDAEVDAWYRAHGF